MHLQLFKCSSKSIRKPRSFLNFVIINLTHFCIKYCDLFLCFLTVHLSIILDNDQLDTHLLYFTLRLLNPLQVSSIVCSSSGGWVVLMQHLVSSSQSVVVRCTVWERTALQFSLIMMSIYCSKHVEDLINLL